ncbi:endonuclease [bacterium SM23_31]|nr:MAG: endonuclease [bacterium SM23_31]
MKGIYCLVITVKKDSTIEIGASGSIHFVKGIYVYVGSAQNNIEKRVARHASKNKKIKWHIDYLLAHSDVKLDKVFYKNAGKNEECETARLLSEFGEPVKRFGCSDCDCISHLFRVRSLKTLNELEFKELI